MQGNFSAPSKDGNRMNKKYTYMPCPTFNKKCDFSVNNCTQINEMGVWPNKQQTTLPNMNIYNRP